MIEVRASVDADGVLRRLESSGHAETDANGSDLVCAAASVLLRTAYETMERMEGVEIEGSAPKPGSLWFSVQDFRVEDAERLKGIWDFLLIGLSGLERERPGALKLTTERYWRK